MRFTEPASLFFKKAVETIFEGSERARLAFTEKGLFVQSVDSLSICAVQFFFPATCFVSFFPQSKSVSFHVRPFFNFFRLHTGPLCIQPDRCTIGGSEYVIRAVSDLSQYYSLEGYGSWPSFEIKPEHFANLVLILSVGGGYLNLEFTDSLCMFTECETGKITVQTNVLGDDFRVLKTGRVRNKYLTKFFKQTCSVAPVARSARFYVEQDCPVVASFDLGECECLVSIAPVKTDQDSTQSLL